MNDSINYYELLGVKKTATKDEINKAYRMQAKKWHPDVNKNDSAVEVIKKLNEAKTTLLDDIKRKDYDIYLDNLVNPSYDKFRKDNTSHSTYQKNNDNYKNTCTKWEYLRDFLKYYNCSSTKKIITVILVLLETIICGTLQIINYLLAYIVSILGGVLYLGASLIIFLFVIVIVLSLLTNSFTNMFDKTNIIPGILVFIFCVLACIMPGVITNFLILKMPSYLASLNIFLFKKCVSYKEL